MTRRSKSVEKFLNSLDSYFENQSEARPMRVFNDELFVFGRISGISVGRRDADNIILADRRRGESLSGKSMTGSLFLSRSDTDLFYDALKSGKEFAVISCGDRAAILYLGLYRSCGIGIMSLTAHPSEVIRDVCREEVIYAFGDAWFARIESDTGGGNTCAFLNDFMVFKGDVLSACGIEIRSGAGCFREMIYSAASMVGCDAVLLGEGFLCGARIGRDTTAAMIICILLAVRSVSEDRRAHIEARPTDGEAVISISFKPYDRFDIEGAAFVEFCRSFGEQYGIPFSFVKRGECYCASFIPERIDPSLGGLKASVEFDFNR